MRFEKTFLRKPSATKSPFFRQNVRKGDCRKKGDLVAEGCSKTVPCGLVRASRRCMPRRMLPSRMGLPIPLWISIAKVSSHLGAEWSKKNLRLAVWRTKNCAISHPLLNEGTFIREYSKSGQETMDTKMI